MAREVQGNIPGFGHESWVDAQLFPEVEHDIIAHVRLHLCEHGRELVEVLVLAPHVGGNFGKAVRLEGDSVRKGPRGVLNDGSITSSVYVMRGMR